MSPTASVPSRQHRQLDLARDLQLSLQRQPVGHFQQHQQIDQEQADEQRERAVGPGGQQHRHLYERRAQRQIDRRKPAIQLDDADERDDECADVERAPRRRQPQREGDEDLAEAQRQPLPPLEMRELLFVQAAAEVPVGVAACRG